MPTISHNKNDMSIKDIYEQIDSLEDPTLPIDTLKSLACELLDTKIGKFLLENKGLNGYWTAYTILYGPQDKNLKPLEKWLLSQSPVVLATRERFHTFQKELMKIIHNDAIVASIPCGLMDDLISLDLSNYKNIKLFGIDIDDNSIELAKDNAKKSCPHSTHFIKKDAWNLEIYNDFDVILSNGLNIYEKDTSKIIQLYKNLNSAIKPGGHLITSFLTPPPNIDESSPWQNYDIIDIIKQKAIFADIIGSKWQNFMNEDHFRDVMKNSGFTIINIIYDKQCMFPTVIAKK